MDWKILIATFTSIFLAELGDKTQIAAIVMTSKTNKPLTVFIGSMIAFAVITLIGVTFGAGLTKIVPIDYIKYLSAIAFIAIGILILNWKIVNLQNRPAAVYTVTSCLLLLSHYPVVISIQLL